MRRPALIALLTLNAPAAAGTVLYGPTAYLSEADSPFAAIAGLTIENFETGALSTPGVSINNGNILDPSSFTDSVDGDDGAIDGSGIAGHSWFHAAANASITFTFDIATLGSLPTHAGIVWTDGGGSVTFEAFDAQGNSLGTRTGSHADTGFSGTTAEDRFYGVQSDAGISAITITNNDSGVEVDHLQFVIPAPSSIAGILIAGILTLRRRRHA